MTSGKLLYFDTVQMFTMSEMLVTFFGHKLLQWQHGVDLSMDQFVLVEFSIDEGLRVVF